MGESSPMWVPGKAEPAHREVRAGLAAGATGLYGDLPPGLGPLLDVAAELVARAFAAYAEGDWETCDGLVTEGREACGVVFAMLVEHIVSPAWPYRVDDPAWGAFLARLAVTVLPAPVPVPAPPPPRQVESEADFLARLDRIVAAADEPRRSPAPSPEPPPAPREEGPAKPDLSEPGALSESLRQMGLM